MRKTLSVILAIVMVLSLSACGKTKTATEAPKPEAPQPASPQTDSPKTGQEEKLSGKVVVWSWDVACKSLQDAAEKFKVKHPDVEFQFEDLGNDQVYDKMTTGLASNVGLPDVVSIEGERVATFASKFPKGFVDVTNEINQRDFLPIKISECTVNGKLVAFPWDAAPCGIFYRQDMFDKAGIKAENIKTWDDFTAAGKQMTKTGVKMLPVAVSRNNMMYRMIMNQLGAFYLDQDGRSAFNSDASVKAMTYVKKMVDAKITYDNVNWDGLVTATKEGKIATVPTAVWWAGTLQDECPEQKGKWRVMRFPSIEGGATTAAVNGGSALLVPAASKNQKAAVAFAKFATSEVEPLIIGFSKYGLYPSYIPSFTDPLFEQGVEYFGGQKIWKMFSEIGKEIPAINFTENFAEADTMSIDAQARILVKGQGVKATLDDLQKNALNKFGK